HPGVRDASARHRRQAPAHVRPQREQLADLAAPRFRRRRRARAAFIRDVPPPSEGTSVPVVQYAGFVPRHRAVRDTPTFDLAEDARIGPDLEAQLGFGLTGLGSDHNFQRLTSTAGWTFPWSRDGFARVSGAFSGRYQDSKFIDHTVTGAVRV